VPQKRLYQHNSLREILTQKTALRIFTVPETSVLQRLQEGPRFLPIELHSVAFQQ
jgi:hypothetical protein